MDLKGQVNAIQEILGPNWKSFYKRNKNGQLNKGVNGPLAKSESGGKGFFLQKNKDHKYLVPALDELYRDVI